MLTNSRDLEPTLGSNLVEIRSAVQGLPVFSLALRSRWMTHPVLSLKSYQARDNN